MKKLEVKSFRERKRKNFKDSEEKSARSLGFYAVNRNTVLTPVNDRFPAQAFDLEVDKFNGFIDKNNLLNKGICGLTKQP